MAREYIIGEKLDDTDIILATLPGIELTKDVRRVAATMGPVQARFLVGYYYLVQGQRIRVGNQVSAMTKTGEPHGMLEWMKASMVGLERQVQSLLDEYSRSQTVGVWARSNLGIGPVLASALLAYIDITKAPTAGHIWSYAGLNPTKVWLKGEKRPWNANLKRVCWLIGKSFQKVQSNPRDRYGHMIFERKAWELVRNNMEVIPGSDPVKYRPIVPGMRGEYWEQAELALAKKNFRPETDAYSWYIQGMLPPAQIDARARRAIVKLFLSHLHEVWYQVYYGEPAPRPYVIEHMGHVDYIPPFHWPLGVE